MVYEDEIGVGIGGVHEERGTGVHAEHGFGHILRALELEPVVGTVTPESFQIQNLVQISTHFVDRRHGSVLLRFGIGTG